MPRTRRGALCLAVESRKPVAPFLVTLSCVAILACGGGDDSGGDGPGGGGPGNSPPQPPPATGVPVRGTERLSWDQGAPSSQRLRDYRFTVYVDGTAVTMTGVQCGETIATDGYPCSAPLPAMSNGNHVLQVSVVVDGVESQRSAALTVTMNSGRIVTSAAIDPQTPPASNGSLCSESGTCLASRWLVTRAAPLSSPAMTPDGRLLFVENGHTVRVLSGTSVVGEPALTLTGNEARIVALLIDPEFERTRAVRIAWTEQHATRGRVLTIARAQEFGNRLGEMAVLVPEIPLSDGNARVAQDDTGRLYVSVPAGGDARVSGDAYAGQLLQFTADGRAWSEGLAPILARGYEQPGALTFDAQSRRLWLAGSDAARGARVTAIPLLETPATVTSLTVTRAPIVGLAALGGMRKGAETSFLTLDTEGTLSLARADAQAFTVLGTMPFDAGRVLSLDTGTGTSGAIFVTTVSAGETAPAFSIHRLDAAAP